jgi:hypothetical protein
VTDQQWESGEENIDESGRNPTQQRMDEELGDDPDEAVERTPHEGEEGQSADA